MAKQSKFTEDPEIKAIAQVFSALKDLEADARNRVLRYVSGKFNIPTSPNVERESTSYVPSISTSSDLSATTDDELDGISPAGRKWITRNGISPSALMKIFSLGIDEIDLIAKSVPGKGKATRQKNIFLLKGMASYLGTGTARFTHEQIKEACLHYDAYDSPNFAKNLNAMSAEVSGTKDTGYTLTAKGISEATTLIKSMSGTE